MRYLPLPWLVPNLEADLEDSKDSSSAARAFSGGGVPGYSGGFEQQQHQQAGIGQDQQEEQINFVLLPDSIHIRKAKNELI